MFVPTDTWSNNLPVIGHLFSILVKNASRMTPAGGHVLGMMLFQAESHIIGEPTIESHHRDFAQIHSEALSLLVALLSLALVMALSPMLDKAFITQGIAAFDQLRSQFVSRLLDMYTCHETKLSLPADI